MKLISHLLAGALLVGSALPMMAQAQPDSGRFGVEHPFNDISQIAIKNYQDEKLGMISDMVVDLVNGRIVEVLVKSEGAPNVAAKIVAVPPRILTHDVANDCYRLNMSADEFMDAPAVDLSNWAESGRSMQIATTYHYFGATPYFLEAGQTPDKKAKWPKVPLGYVELTSRLLNMPVGNMQNQDLGTLFSINFSVKRGLIEGVVVLAPGNFATKRVVPAMALAFNSKRDALLLDDTKQQYADEPRYIFTEPAYGNEASFEEEPYAGQPTHSRLAQGSDQFDIYLTVSINRNIRAATTHGRNVQVGTLDGRVTLRGWVPSADDKARIEAIAVAATKLDLVDDQIIVGKPITAN